MALNSLDYQIKDNSQDDRLIDYHDGKPSGIRLKLKDCIMLVN